MAAGGSTGAAASKHAIFKKDKTTTERPIDKVEMTFKKFDTNKVLKVLQTL